MGDGDDADGGRAAPDDATCAEQVRGVFGSTSGGSVFRVRVCGDLDLGIRRQLEAVAEAFRGSGCRHVVIELTRLTFLNSLGLNFMAALELHCRRLGGSATIVDPGHDVVELLSIAGLAPRFTLVQHPPHGDARVPAQRSCHPH